MYPWGCLGLQARPQKVVRRPLAPLPSDVLGAPNTGSARHRPARAHWVCGARTRRLDPGFDLPLAQPGETSHRWKRGVRRQRTKVRAMPCLVSPHMMDLCVEIFRMGLRQLGRLPRIPF